MTGTKIENIPDELKAVPQWVCWKMKDKVPMNPHTGRNAKSDDPSTWSDFDTAVAACERFGFAGLGFELVPPFFGVDLDHCIDDKEFCEEFVGTLQSYAEYSKSGTGIHIICKGTLPEGPRRRGNVEMYSNGRYFICTGNIFDAAYTKVVDCTDTVKVLHSKYLPPDTPRAEQRRIVSVSMDDREIIEKAKNCRSGRLFADLYEGNWHQVYPSQSEADLALCNQLAFWTQKNEEQMDRIFRSSGLMRDKWNRRQSGTTYGAITIGKACANCVEVYEPGKYDDDTSIAIAMFRGGTVGVETQKKLYDMTDTGNAHRFYDKFGNIFHYSYNRKKWFFWNGKCWRIDDTGEVKKHGDKICEDIKREGYQEQDEKTQADLLKWATKTASSRGKEAMIKECQHLKGIPASPDDFDTDAEYLNCQNGIINLRNGELIPHDSRLNMSRICYAEYDADGGEPKLWLKFLDDVTNGNKDLQKYIQKSVGYSLTGSNREQCAYFLYGMGNNGKSTFLDTISNLLGTYAANVQPETIMTKKWGDSSALSDIARLKSTRFVACEEPTEGVRLNEGLLKQLTGGSKVTCRFLYGDEFEYTPEFKIWMATNHKPVVRGTDIGIWWRIKLIPFEVNIPAEKVIKDLKYKLRKEFPQILKWAIDGCRMWIEEGLDEPECVKNATKEYKQEMDLLAGFLEQCVEIDYAYAEITPAKYLFRAYCQWAKDNNEYEMSSKRFFTEITKKLPDKGRNGKGIYYKYVKLVGEYRQYGAEDFYKE